MSMEQVGMDEPYVTIRDDAVRSMFNAVKGELWMSKVQGKDHQN